MLSRIKEEIITAIPAIIFFIISLNLINFTQGLMLRSEHVQPYSYLTVTVFALFLGKFLIVVNNFSFINAFPRRPLIYNIAWKMCIYGVLVFVFRIIERFIEESIRNESFRASYENICHAIVTPVFWAAQLWVLMLFLIYIVSGEFIRVLGRDKVDKMLWG